MEWISFHKFKDYSADFIYAFRLPTLPAHSPAIDGLVEYVSGGPQPGGMYFAVAHGVHAVRLGNEASISQTIQLKQALSMPSHLGHQELVHNSTGRGFERFCWASGGESSPASMFRAIVDVAKVTFHNPGVQENPSCGPLLDAVAMKELFPPRPTRVLSSFLASHMAKNGNFEEFPHLLVNSSNCILLPPRDRKTSHPHCPGESSSPSKAVKIIDSNHINVSFGKAAIELVAGRENTIAQIICTVPNKFYNLVFTVGDAKNGCHGSMMVEAFAAKVTLKLPFTSQGKGRFKPVRLKFQAISDRTRLTFRSSFYHTRVDESMTLGLFAVPFLIKLGLFQLLEVGF